MKTVRNLISYIGSVSMLVSTLTFAGSDIFDNSLSSCTTPNCSSLSIPGAIYSDGISAENLTLSLFVGAHQCARFDLTSPTAVRLSDTDFEMVVVAPDGTVYRNDDRSSTDARPLVAFNSGPTAGWYTVHIGQYAGHAITTNSPLLQYGLYTEGNPNCVNPTAPL